VAERRLADLQRLVREHFGDRSDPEPVRLTDLLDRSTHGPEFAAIVRASFMTTG
jgi:hypothetical protein